MVTIDAKQLSEEIKLASPTDQTSYRWACSIPIPRSRAGTTARSFRPGSSLIPSETKTTDCTRGTLKFAGDNSLVVGLRYNYDQISYDYSKVFFPPPPVTQVLTDSASDSESTVVGDISLQHKFGNGTMTYLTYARGYSPAAYNTAYVSYVDDDPSTPYTKNLGTADKMDVDHFELGSRGRTDGRLRVNAAAFYTKYKAFQVQIFDSSSVSLAPPLQLSNAGGAETKGIELDLQYAATDTLRLDLNAAYIDAEFTEYKGAPCYYADQTGIVPVGSSCFQDLNGNDVQDTGEPGPGGALAGVAGVVQDLSGKGMPLSPKFKFVLGAEQRIPLSAGGNIVLGANYSWRDEAQMLVDQNPYGVQDSFGILNLSVVEERLQQAVGHAVLQQRVRRALLHGHPGFRSAPVVNTIVGQVARDTNRYLGRA
jgi:iron complex outermembrane receptor protein